jgi:hypothetical protein
MNVYPYPIKNIVPQIVPHVELSAYNLNSVHAASLFKCIFKNAFQYTSIQDYDDEFIVKRNNKMEECFQKFVQYVTLQLARQHSQWTRRQLLEEVNDVIIEIIDEFIAIIRRFALLYDGDETDDPHAIHGPLYQTADTIQHMVANTNFKRFSKEWLKRRDTRRVRVGVHQLRKSVRRPVSQVMNDPYLSHKISNMAIRNSISMDEEAEIDKNLQKALPHYKVPRSASSPT